MIYYCNICKTFIDKFNLFCVLGCRWSDKVRDIRMVAELGNIDIGQRPQAIPRLRGQEGPGLLRWRDHQGSGRAVLQEDQ